MGIRFRILTLALILLTAINSKTQNFYSALNFGGNDNDYGVDIHACDDNTIYITGTFKGDSVDFDPGPAVYYLHSFNQSVDIFIARYKQNGELMWAKSIGGDTSQLVKTMVVDDAANIYIAGRFFGVAIDFDPGPATALRSASGTTDFFIASYDSSGNYRWAHNIGGSSLDDCNSITFDLNGNLLITGTFLTSAVDFDPGTNIATLNALNGEMFIGCYDRNGNYLWAKNTGGLNIIPRKIRTAENGDIYITGDFMGTNINFDPDTTIFTISSAGDWDIFVARYTPDASCKWAFRAGGTGQDIGFCLKPFNHSIYIAGRYNGNKIDFDPGPDTAYLTSVGLNDLYLARYDSSGLHEWSLSIGSKGFEAAQNIEIDTSQTILLYGNIGDTIDFDPGPDSLIIDNTSGVYFLARFDTLGNLMQVGNFGGGLVYGTALSVNKQNEIFLTGAFAGDSADFHPHPYDTFLLHSFGGLDPFIARFAPEPAMNIFPEFNHVSCNKGNNGDISITITGGRKPYSLTWNSGQSTSAINNLTANYYKVSVTDSRNIRLQRGILITQPDPLTDSVLITETCSGFADGSLSLFLSGATKPYLLLWNTGNTTSSLNNLFAGSYTVTVTDSIGCINTLQYSLANYNEPIADSIFGPSAINGGDTAWFYVQLLPGSSVIWRIYTGTYMADNNDSIQIIIPLSGSLHIEAQELTADGCLSDTLQIFIPVTITVSRTVTCNNIIIFPNPVCEQLFINHLPANETTITLFSSTGTILMKQTINVNTAVIDMENIIPGIYIIELTVNGSKQHKKIIKQ